MVTSAPRSGRPPAPGAGRAQCSEGLSSPRLRLRPRPRGWLLQIAQPRLRCPGSAAGRTLSSRPRLPKAGGGNWEGTRQTQAPAHLSRKGRGAGRAEKPPKSLELGKTGPSRAPLLSAAPGSSAGALGRVRRRPAVHTGPGAGRCCLGEGASLTSSRAAISHAVRTLNLKGPCVPASEQAGFCF